MRRHILFIILSVFTALTACGGGGGGTTGESGTVALFVTDNLADFDQVTTTITGVEILHTGSGASCPVLSDAVALDISELSSEFLLLDVASCEAAQYNRIRVEMSETVALGQDDTEQECTFASYKDSGNKPNVLQCNDGTCSMDINGMVNVAANQGSTLVLDFDLKEFEVENFGEEGCTVTMKVEPLNANDIDDKKKRGIRESIKGFISDLDTTAQSFALTREEDIFTVFYSGVTQEGIDSLLVLAQDNALETKVRCSSFNLESNECTASEIYVEVKGTVSDLTASTFTLTFNPEISVDYTGAKLDGVLADGAKAEVKLSEFDGANYLSYEVEVEDEDEL